MTKQKRWPVYFATMLSFSAVAWEQTCSNNSGLLASDTLSTSAIPNEFPDLMDEFSFQNLHATHSQSALVRGVLSMWIGGPTRNPPPPIFLDQGWDDTTRTAFYYTPQGSRMLPFAWFLHLE